MPRAAHRRQTETESGIQRPIKEDEHISSVIFNHNCRTASSCPPERASAREVFSVMLAFRLVCAMLPVLVRARLLPRRCASRPRRAHARDRDDGAHDCRSATHRGEHTVCAGESISTHRGVASRPTLHRRLDAFSGCFARHSSPLLCFVGRFHSPVGRRVLTGYSAGARVTASSSYTGRRRRRRWRWCGPYERPHWHRGEQAI